MFNFAKVNDKGYSSLLHHWLFVFLSPVVVLLLSIPLCRYPFGGVDYQCAFAP